MERLELGVLLDDGTYICDGCNVAKPHEHRCHHDDGRYEDGRSCQCRECNPTAPIGPVEPEWPLPPELAEMIKKSSA